MEANPLRVPWVQRAVPAARAVRARGALLAAVGPAVELDDLRVAAARAEGRDRHANISVSFSVL